jgi:TolA-binding protein
MTGDANTDYNAAIALVKDASRQDDAMAAFQNFVKKYPDSTYQPNANYWLGQLNYNKGKRRCGVLFRLGGEELPEIAESARCDV